MIIPPKNQKGQVQPSHVVVGVVGVPANIYKNGPNAYGISLVLPPFWQPLKIAKKVLALVATDSGTYYIELTRYRELPSGRLLYFATGPSRLVLKDLYGQNKRVVNVIALMPR